MTHVYHTCLLCDHEVEVAVELDEGDDLPESCPGCGQDFPESAHEKVQVAAFEKATGNCEDNV